MMPLPSFTGLPGTPRNITWEVNNLKKTFHDNFGRLLLLFVCFILNLSKVKLNVSLYLTPHPSRQMTQSLIW